jgi:hypothetical protein
VSTLRTRSSISMTACAMHKDQGRERYAYAFTLWQKAQDRYASVLGEAQANELRQRLLEIGRDDQLT